MLLANRIMVTPKSLSKALSKRLSRQVQFDEQLRTKPTCDRARTLVQTRSTSHVQEVRSGQKLIWPWSGAQDVTTSSNVTLAHLSAMMQVCLSALFPDVQGKVRPPMELELQSLCSVIGGRIAFSIVGRSCHVGEERSK